MCLLIAVGLSISRLGRRCLPAFSSFSRAGRLLFADARFLFLVLRARGLRLRHLDRRFLNLLMHASLQIDCSLWNFGLKLKHLMLGNSFVYLLLCLRLEACMLARQAWCLLDLKCQGSLWYLTLACLNCLVLLFGDEIQPLMLNQNLLRRLLIYVRLNNCSILYSF